ncbi:MAG TPA: hypothetical protein VFU13_22735 [Steroidobacteraceae bacterium]|nr:hypothetical protein [Steroidobacteraceae bacterium]
MVEYNATDAGQTETNSALGLGVQFVCAFMIALASGCTNARERPAEVFGGPEVASFNLSCASCMAPSPSQCRSPAGLPVAAIVSGAKVLDRSGRCGKFDDDPNSSQPCLVLSALRFDSVRFLRNSGQASATDTFRGHSEHERLEPEEQTGVVLDPGKTYVVFAGRNQPADDWYISIACEIPPVTEDKRD